MQLTCFTDYSLRVLIFLAKHPERLYTVKEISLHYNISRNHLVKVVHNLSLIGLIVSTKGKGGGIRLKHAPQRMNLKNIMASIEPDLALVECSGKTVTARNEVEENGLKDIFRESVNAFTDNLAHYTLADLLAETRS